MNTQTERNRRTQAEVVVKELDDIAKQITSRILQCSETINHLARMSRDDLAMTLKAEITSLLFTRDLVDARIKAINEGATV